MSQVDSTVQANGPYSNPLDDLEYKGGLNRATAQGAKFALLLAMLEQNSLWRPTIARDDDGVTDYYQNQLAELSYYRKVPLAANEDYWASVKQTEHYIHNGELQNARLWLAMHPEPLSLHNDVMHISDDVLANCALSVQTRVKHNKPDSIPEDATMLYDILHQVETPTQPAMA